MGIPRFQRWEVQLTYCRCSPLKWWVASFSLGVLMLFSGLTSTLELAHHLCDQANIIFAEDLNLKAM